MVRQKPWYSNDVVLAIGLLLAIYALIVLGGGKEKSTLMMASGLFVVLLPELVSGGHGISPGWLIIVGIVLSQVINYCVCLVLVKIVKGFWPRP